MKCIAIDDEPQALKVIEAFCRKTDFLDLQQSFRSAVDALDYLHSHPTDLIFLDIEMPDLSGMEFLASLSKHPQLIFTTAYAEYALESYQYEAVGYLLKPIAFAQFLKAVNRARKNSQTTVQPAEKPEENRLFVKSGTITHALIPENILAVEASGNQVIFHLQERKLEVSMSLTTAEELLPSQRFCRVHRSFMVNLAHIQAIEQHQLSLPQLQVPIGRLYRHDFLKRINIH